MMEKLSAEELKKNLTYVQERIFAAAYKVGRDPQTITLLAATKTVDADTVNSAVDQGIAYIGENRVQEMLSKFGKVKPCHRHFIGHLQTNKVKDVIDQVEMIESVSSLKLANEISKQALRRGVVMPVLVEVNIGSELSKSGFSPEELPAALLEIAKWGGITVKGLMAIPPVGNTPEDSRKYFQKMYKLFIDMREKNIDNIDMEVLSMGMSQDFDIAVEEGATIVRVGTSLFGKRI